MPTPTKRHDPRLPAWGPYTKRYTGLSHIPDLRQGLRFDIGILPGFYRRKTLVPNARWESDHHPWEAAPDLSYYAYRYELEWKDQVYVDVSVSALSDSARLIRTEMVNNTAADQNLALNLVAYLNFPPVRSYSDEALQPMRVNLPAGAAWIDALDYSDLQFATPRPSDSLVYDGHLRGEVRKHGLVNGSAVGLGFGREAGDRIDYCLTLPQPMPAAQLLLRYRLEAPGETRFIVSGPVETSLTLTGNEAFEIRTIALGDLPAGEIALRLVSQGGQGIEFDGFVLLTEGQDEQVSFHLHNWSACPEILPGPRVQSLVLKYADSEVYYGLAWNTSDYVLREILNDELDRFMRHMVHEHVQKILRGPGEGHFTNIYMRPVHILPASSQVIYSLACAGSRSEVEAELARFPFEAQPLDEVYRTARARAVAMTSSESGQPYRFSQERMAATTLMNVVYPVYTRRTYIRHFTPGKWWDCLYTWDSGFVGLGLLELDIQRAIDSLDAYVTDPGDEQAAFLHHGSFVPVQMYLFKELWNRMQDRSLLEYFYPRLRQYYQFYAGHLGSSTTRSLKSNLLKTWDYFYNSGGWDDYPPQVFTHANGLAQWVTPCVNTAHAIRSAKILRSAAQALGASDDLAFYDEDIQAFTQALQRHAWDEQAGTFSYVVHDEDGLPQKYLIYDQDGKSANYNLGMDGASPLYAGICTRAQEERLVNRLFSPDHMWTRAGLSTVDQAAPYYRKDGYWNGAVWMPHQWFFWKALLDLERGQKAHQIARTALSVWKTEVEESYNCCEHFIVQSGRGAGWHQFSGLSTPVMAWYNAYHRPGRLTTGLDAWVERSNFTDHNRSLVADLKLNGQAGRAATVIVTLQPGLEYRATWNGQDAASSELYPGTLQITLNNDDQTGRLVIIAL